MLEPISKHNTTTKVQNNYPLKSYKEKNKHLVIINDSIDNNIDNNIINYYHEEFQLTKNDENIIFNPNEWLNNQHLTITMQVLYVQKLQLFGYQQHTYIDII
jgi:glucuronate isomerase